MNREKLSKGEIKMVVDRLSNEFNSDQVEYLGYNRFVVRVPFHFKALTGELLRLYKDRLFDENCEEIPLRQEYNSIFKFTSGLAVVCIRTQVEINDGRSSHSRKDGLIDVNGNELLPCIYDAIRPKQDGHAEITKNGITKFTNINKIINGSFNWEDAIETEN